MTKPRFTLRGAHLLMWSSPLLLLVLVFTLTSSNTTPAEHHPVSAARDVTTSTKENTTTTLPVTSSTTTTSMTPSTTTTASRSYASVTSSTVKSTGPAPIVNVASGELEGHVSAELPVDVIPLQGPGTWTLSTTSPSLNVLACDTTTHDEEDNIVLLSNESCQLQIASATTGASLTWLLTPGR